MASSKDARGGAFVSACVRSRSRPRLARPWDRPRAAARHQRNPERFARLASARLFCIVTSLGRVVAGRYRMLYPLGRGGMGAVWVGEHIELKSAVAVKFIDQHLAEDERAKKRFRLEAQAGAALRPRTRLRAPRLEAGERIFGR